MHFNNNNYLAVGMSSLVTLLSNDVNHNEAQKGKYRAHSYSFA